MGESGMGQWVSRVEGGCLLALSFSLREGPPEESGGLQLMSPASVMDLSEVSLRVLLRKAER